MKKIGILLVVLFSVSLIKAQPIKYYKLDTLNTPYVVYRQNPDLKLYFLYPKGVKGNETRATIVFFSGGGWVKASPQAFASQGKYLAERGMVAVLADYRVTERHGTTPVECVEDAKSIMRYLKANARKHHIDTCRLAAGGGSAGGHLAAATAFVKGFDAPTDDLSVSPVPKALVLFNPVFNNAPYPEGWGNKRVSHLFPQISPYHNLTPDAPPTLIMTGTEDELLPVSTVEKYAQRMDSLGARCEVEFYDGAGHGFFNPVTKYKPAEGPSYFVQTALRMEEFLKSIGYIETK